MLKIAEQLGLIASLNPRGRPKVAQKTHPDPFSFPMQFFVAADSPVDASK